MTEAEKTERLHRDQLASGTACGTLGIIAARQLVAHGQASFYLDEDGYVAVASPGEFKLDGMPEEMAINTLHSQGWTDDEIADYLKGRDARMKHG